MLLGLAGAWAITEWLRAGMFTGFAWNPVGVTLADTHLLNAATVIGTYGLSALVVLAGGMLWFLVRKEWRIAGGLLALIVAMHFLPWPETEAAKGSIRVIQPNIGQQDKWRPGYSEIAAQTLAKLSMQPGGSQPRLLFWPEAAVTNPLQDQRGTPYDAYAEFERARAASMVGPGDVLLTGGIALNSTDGARVTSAANSVFVFGQGGRLLGRYDKAHLVPFGEYLPMRPLLSSLGLSRLAPGDVDFISGPGPRTIDSAELGQGRLPALLRDHLLGRGRGSPQPAGLHLQPVERRLVRLLGPAAASRPGAASRGRGRAFRSSARRRPGSARSSMPTVRS